MTFKRKNPLITPEFVAQARQLTVTEAKEVTKLNLSGFQLRGTAIVQGFSNLQLLDLSVNELTELKLEPDSVQHLEVLNLSFNQLRSLKFLNQIKQDLIKSLILNDNFFTGVTMNNFHRMPKLTLLNLSNCSNQAGERVKKNSVMIDCSAGTASLVKRLGSGFKVDNASPELFNLGTLDSQPSPAPGPAAWQPAK